MMRTRTGLFVVILWVVIGVIVLGFILVGGFILLVGGAHMGPGSAMPAMKSMALGVRADGGQLKIALGAQCPAGVTYTVMFDRDNLTVGSESKTEVFTSDVPLTVFDPFQLPPGTTVVTPFPTGFQWQNTRIVDVHVRYADGQEGYDTAVGMSKVNESSQYPPDTYYFGPQWLTIDQALANPKWVTACSPK